ncbi:MAG: glycosyltransferase [Elusimicrobia bacterium]|nr:glycosyltransferase [Elusimicrobiota bacterium]
MSAPRLAVVLPVHDEEAVIGPVLAALLGALRGLPWSALEVVVVDDGSRDGTVAAVRAAWDAAVPSDRPARLTVASLPARAGHQRALAEGFRRARAAGAERLLSMDADGQDDPAALPALLALLDSHEVVFAERAGRAEALWWRAGHAAYRVLFRLALGFDLPYGNYCAFRADVADDLLAAPPFRHLAATLAAGPYRVASVKVARRPRLGGRAKMSPLALAGYGLAAVNAARSRARPADEAPA